MSTSSEARPHAVPAEGGCECEVRFCRICGEEESPAEEELIRPCGCRGTAAFAHFKCVQRWISTPKEGERSSRSCEVCGQEWGRRFEFDIPDEAAAAAGQRVSVSDEERWTVAPLVLEALARISAGRPLPMDFHTCQTFGPMLPHDVLQALGDVDVFATQLVGLRPTREHTSTIDSQRTKTRESLFGRLKRGMRKLFAGLTAGKQDGA